MINEKAISILRRWKNIGKNDMTEERLGYIEGWFHEYDVEAFDMAIKALEERKTGRWAVNKAGVMRCPFCHKNMNPRKGRKPKYCDECGAKLECAEE